jgi:hypothetical protein
MITILVCTFSKIARNQHNLIVVTLYSLFTTSIGEIKTTLGRSNSYYWYICFMTTDFCFLTKKTKTTFPLGSLIEQFTQYKTEVEKESLELQAKLAEKNVHICVFFWFFQKVELKLLFF